MNWIRSIIKPMDTTPLHHAVMYGPISEVVNLIDNGADVNACDKSKHTPLHKVAFLLDDDEIYDKACILLNNKADVNAQTITGTTLLHWAAVDLSTEVIVLLLANGADPTITDMWGYTPSDMATLYGKIEIVELFTDATQKHL